MCNAEGEATAFLCPNGTIFNQQYFICDWWFNVDCSQVIDMTIACLFTLFQKIFIDQAESLYGLNDEVAAEAASNNGAGGGGGDYSSPRGKLRFGNLLL